MKNEKRRPWITFHSFTGSEIKNIINELGIAPDACCTNNAQSPIIGGGRRVFKRNWDETAYRQVLDRYDNPLVTLHGWMRIVPPEICEDYEIYNGHPALISDFPDLKGKDKQEDVINNVDKYPEIGSVIHTCTAELDAGPIQISVAVPNFKVHRRELIYDVLRDTSLRTWLQFLPKRLL